MKHKKNGTIQLIKNLIYITSLSTVILLIRRTDKFTLFVKDRVFPNQGIVFD